MSGTNYWIMVIIISLILALDVMAIFKIIKSDLVFRKKILWGLIVAVLQPLGLALYYLSGKKLINTTGKTA